MREVQDHFFKEARREGYRSRAAYKLLEIDDRRKVLAKGDLVLDCGAAPGSWMQVAAARVGPEGRILGVDLMPIEANGLPGNVTTFEGDVREIDLVEALGDRADVVLSDMALSTTGTPSADQFRSAHLCGELLDLLPALLRRGGNCVMKVFEGEAYPELLQRSARMFDRAKGFKPQASRSESVEIYVVCHDFKGVDPEAPEFAAQPPRTKPSGWGSQE
jgi:23S rRNA (uridine2552-2'-O)-methyltransferase